MSVSNQIYSSTIAGLNPLKNLLVSEGEKLVSFIILLYYWKIFNFHNYRLVVPDFVKSYGKK